MKRFKLEDIEKKETPFKAPEGYFDELPIKIQRRIDSLQRQKVSWFQTPAFRVAISSAAVILIVLSIVFINGSDPNSNGDRQAEEILAQVNEEELMLYVNGLELGEEEILTAFENNFEGLDFSGDTELENLELEDEALDKVLDEYELSEEYLEI